MRIQTDNGLGDLIFIACVLVLALLLLRGLYLLIRRRSATGTFAWIVVLVAVYAGALVVSGVMTKPVLVPAGTAKCSDEWCVTVDGATTYPSLPGLQPTQHVVVVRVRAFSEAARRAQRGSDPQIALVGADGTTAGPDAAAQAAVEKRFGAQPPLDTPIAPHESFVTLQAVVVAHTPSHVVVKLGERPWITRIILFNDNSLFAGGTLFSVDVTPGA